MTCQPAAAARAQALVTHPVLSCLVVRLFTYVHHCDLWVAVDVNVHVPFNTKFNCRTLVNPLTGDRPAADGFTSAFNVTLSCNETRQQSRDRVRSTGHRCKQIATLEEERFRTAYSNSWCLLLGNECVARWHACCDTFVERNSTNYSEKILYASSVFFLLYVSTIRLDKQFSSHNVQFILAHRTL